MIVLWVIALFLAFYLFSQTSGFMQEPLQLDPGNENMKRYSQILSSCGNVDIPWTTCNDSFKGLPWQYSSMFEDNIKARMCDSNGLVNRVKMNEYLACPK